MELGEGRRIHEKIGNKENKKRKIEGKYGKKKAQ